MNFTSRSPIEAYPICNRLRYNQYHLLGTGLVGKLLSVPLVTGTAVHRGVEHLANRVRIGQTPDVDTAVGLAVDEYIKECEGLGFSGKGLKTNAQQWFTFCEQKALLEGLIRMWYLMELPNIVQRYKILSVEREIVPVVLFKNENNIPVRFMARVDMELQELSTGEYYNYSLKTVNRWDERSEQTYKSDLQGITESWAIERESIEMRDIWINLTKGIEYLSEIDPYDRKLTAIIEYMARKTPPTKKLMGVRFCFLVKGMRRKDIYNGDENSPYVTHSPLIRGYRYITPTEVSYAHSWTYPNPNNKSGRGTLGKGWEFFNVWESDISIKDWIDALYKNMIQPECGNVLRANTITPPEYFRDDAEIEQAMREVISQETQIAHALKSLDAQNGKGLTKAILESVFPHSRRSCYFMFGEECPYLALCWKPEVAADPLGSGLYQIRVPHHKPERDAIVTGEEELI